MKIVFSIFTFVCIICPLEARPDSLSYFRSLGQNISSDFNSAGDDAVFIWKEFGTIGSVNSLAIGGGVIAGTGVAFLVDEQLRTELQKGHTESLDKLNSTFREYGSTYSILGSSVGIYVVGLLTESEEIRTTGRLVTEALFVSGCINGSLKVIIGRGRPYLNVGNDKFKPLNFANNYNSLPSGHTTVAFTISTVLADQIDRWWATVGLYGLATATAYSRMYNDAHWLSDVFLGASIGYISGKLITTAHRNRKSTNSSLFRLYPTIGGVGCTYQF
jgi:hypothetical protein